MKINIQKNSKVVAWISLQPCFGGNIEIEFIKVDKDYYSSGLATILLNRAKNKFKDTDKCLVAFIEHIKDSSLDYEQKEQWLIRHGFKKQKRYFFGDCYKDVMIYTPKHNLNHSTT